MAEEHSRPDGRSIEVGFESDLASSPKFLWIFIPPNGDYDVAAWYHDKGLSFVEKGLASRHDADRQFRSDLKDDGIGFICRWVLYFGVRLGTFKAFINHKVKQWQHS